MAGLSLSHGHGRGSLAPPFLPQAICSRQRRSWVAAAAGRGVWELKEVGVKDGVKPPQRGECCKGEATFLFLLALLEGSNGI